jgi:uncharacterized protein (DUF433 family)
MCVSDVLSLLAAGASVAEILEDYPYLTDDDIVACLQYATHAATVSLPAGAGPPCLRGSQPAWQP